MSFKARDEKNNDCVLVYKKPFYMRKSPILAILPWIFIVHYVWCYIKMYFEYRWI